MGDVNNMRSVLQAKVQLTSIYVKPTEKRSRIEYDCSAPERSAQVLAEEY